MTAHEADEHKIEPSANVTLELKSWQSFPNPISPKTASSDEIVIHVWVLGSNIAIGGHSTFSTAAKVILSMLSSHANEHLSCRDSPTCFFFTIDAIIWLASPSFTLKRKSYEFATWWCHPVNSVNFRINLKICEAKFLF